MQQMVRALGQGLSQKFRVKRLHVGVFVGEAKRRRFIKTPENISALLGALYSIVDWLTAAARAAAGTRHDLDKVILYAAGLERLQKLSGVSKATHDRRPDRARAGNLERSFQPCMPRTAVKASGSGLLPVTR